MPYPGDNDNFEDFRRAEVASKYQEDDQRS